MRRKGKSSHRRYVHSGRKGSRIKRYGSSRGGIRL